MAISAAPTFIQGALDLAAPLAPLSTQDEELFWQLIKNLPSKNKGSSAIDVCGMHDAFNRAVPVKIDRIRFSATANAPPQNMAPRTTT